ncbi:MAG: 4a-hydroxytetrahydrobiopterin dehydratase [Pseudomonadota bacterium]
MSNNAVILSEKDREQLKAAGWAQVEGRDAVQKRYQFADFKTAFAFMSFAAFHAEGADHHPEWFNVYNKVDVTLTTHDAGGVTDKDAALAEIMDAHAEKLGVS